MTLIFDALYFIFWMDFSVCFCLLLLAGLFVCFGGLFVCCYCCLFVVIVVCLFFLRRERCDAVYSFLGLSSSPLLLATGSSKSNAKQTQRFPFSQQPQPIRHWLQPSPPRNALPCPTPPSNPPPHPSCILKSRPDVFTSSLLLDRNTRENMYNEDVPVWDSVLRR